MSESTSPRIATFERKQLASNLLGFYMFADFLFQNFRPLLISSIGPIFLINNLVDFCFRALPLALLFPLLFSALINSYLHSFSQLVSVRTTNCISLSLSSGESDPFSFCSYFHFSAFPSFSFPISLQLPRISSKCKKSRTTAVFRDAG